MAKAKTAWGIDIGQCALKALKLIDYGDGRDPQVEAFEIIEHAEVLSNPDADRDQLIRQSLESLLVRHNLSGSRVALSVPGQNSFTRFFRPPPVEPKGLPRIIQFEAGQQIPFPIDEVIWRWQAFQEEDSPELEVGIFAMKRLDVAEAIGHLEAVGIAVDLVQVSPLALYNFLIYDEQAAEDGATLLVDIGADTTDLVVADRGRTWTRTIQIGGNNFTDALSKSFKLSFGKAETLKRTASTSKYARQVFQVMRPVFADFVQEIQRSVSYYISLHRDSKFTRLVGLGNGFRLPGLQKFLEQNLNIPVVRIEDYNNLTPAPGVNVPLFNEGILAFPTAYGLAVQLLRPVSVSTNLLPEEIARRRLWVRKIPWFGVAAGLLLLTLACPTYRSYVDRKALSDPSRLREAFAIRDELKGYRDEFTDLKEQGLDDGDQTDAYVDLLGYRNVMPSLQAFVGRSIHRVTAQGGRDVQEMLAEYVGATDFAQREAIRDKIQQIPRDQRRVIYAWKIDYRYVGELSSVVPSAIGRGYTVTLTATTPLGEHATVAMIDALHVESKLVAEELSSISLAMFESQDQVIAMGVAAPAGLMAGEVLVTEDPFLPDESMSADMLFTVRWLIAVDDDGLDDIYEEQETPQAAD